MYSGKLVFPQLFDHLPLHSFRNCVRRYRGNHKLKSFHCLEQYLCMTFWPTDLLGEPAQHRGLPPGARFQALPHGHPGRGFPQHTLQRQQGARLAHPRELRASPDPDCTAAARQRGLGTGTGQHRCTSWIPQRSTCACRSSRGRCFVQPNPPSSCTSCWTCAEAFRPSSTSRPGNSTT